MYTIAFIFEFTFYIFTGRDGATEVIENDMFSFLVEELASEVTGVNVENGLFD